MARLHSKRKGKSKRKRAKRKEKAEFVVVEDEQIKEIVRELYLKGTPPSRIGQILRDEYGVPSFKAQTGEKIMSYLIKENLYKTFPEDLLNLFRKAVGMNEHLKKNKKDISNKVKMRHVESKIKRLLKYYKRVGKVPRNWNYSIERAALLVR